MASPRPSAARCCDRSRGATRRGALLAVVKTAHVSAVAMLGAGESPFAVSKVVFSRNFSYVYVRSAQKNKKRETHARELARAASRC